MRKLIVVLDRGTKAQREMITSYFEDHPRLFPGYWHWFADLWLVLCGVPDLDLRKLTKTLVRTAEITNKTRASLLVLEIGEAIDSTGFAHALGWEWLKLHWSREAPRTGRDDASLIKEATEVLKGKFPEMPIEELAKITEESVERVRGQSERRISDSD